jgi:hypothetical protein
MGSFRIINERSHLGIVTGKDNYQPWAASVKSSCGEPQRKGGNNAVLVNYVQRSSRPLRGGG